MEYISLIKIHNLFCDISVFEILQFSNSTSFYQTDNLIFASTDVVLKLNKTVVRCCMQSLYFYLISLRILLIPGIYNRHLHLVLDKHLLPIHSTQLKRYSFYHIFLKYRQVSALNSRIWIQIFL